MPPTSIDERSVGVAAAIDRPPTSTPPLKQPSSPKKQRKKSGRKASDKQAGTPGGSRGGAGGAAAPVTPAPLVAPLGSPTHESTAAGRGTTDLAALGVAAPFAAAALASLTAIAAQFGSGLADVSGAQSNSLLEAVGGRPLGPIMWTGAGGAGYSVMSQGTTRHTAAVDRLSDELRGLLADSAATANHGHARIESIIADTRAALVALGPIADTPAGRAMVLAAITSALERAGILLSTGQSEGRINADRISALAAHYLADPARSTTSGPPRTRPSGNVGKWIDEALNVLAARGHNVSGIDPADIATMIQKESSGNPNAINLWDSNAAAGHPSKGLMQTIDSTFAAFSIADHRDIWNPVDNIIAGVRYAEDRYGSVANVPGLRGMRAGSGYVGY